MADRRIGAGAAALALLLAGCVADGGPRPWTASEPASGSGLQAAAVAGVSVAAPAWRVGDRWTYSDGYGLEVEDVAGGETRFRRQDDADQWISRRGFLRQDSQSATTGRSVVFRSIAAKDAAVLRLGEPIVFTREFTSNDVMRTHTTSWLLEGEEKVSVPAGDFHAYVVVMRTRNPETGWTGFERWWYAPAIRHYVRMEYRYGDQPVGSRVLTEFELAGPRQAVEVRPEIFVTPAAADVQKLPDVSQRPPMATSSGQIVRTAAPSASQGPNGSSSPVGSAEAAFLAATP